MEEEKQASVGQSEGTEEKKEAGEEKKARKFHVDHPLQRSLLLVLGLCIMAFGVAFSIKAGLGTSPISSLPYVTSAISTLSVGVTTIIINFLIIVLQMVILRKRFELLQLLQFPATVIFGLMIDVAEMALEGIPDVVSFVWGWNYVYQWFLCIVGIFLVGLGVTIEVSAKLVTTAGEGLVLAICKVCPKLKFSYMKIAVDVSLVLLSVCCSFIFLHTLVGVREGTVAAAIFVGLTTKLLRKPIAKFSSLCLADRKKTA